MRIRNLMYVTMFAAIMGVLGFIPPIILGFTPVPITLQSLGVMLSGSVLGARLGPKYGTIVNLIYINSYDRFTAIIWRPWWIGVFFGPSGGYLLGYASRCICNWTFIISHEKCFFIKVIL